MADQNQTPPPNPASSSSQASDPLGRRLHYDYSRSTSSNKNHWYGVPGQGDPLAGQKGTSSSSPPPPVRRPSPAYGGAHQPPITPTSPARQRLNERKTARRKFQNNWAWAIIAVAMLGLTIVTSLVLIIVLQSDGDSNNTRVSDLVPKIEPTSIIYNDNALILEDDTTPIGGALEGNAMEIHQWDGENRLTILLMGMDNRPGQQRTICRTDTIMVISLDPDARTIGILSIPRDTYVEVPNYGLERINTACVLGNLERPGYGPELAMQTVQYNFGIRVNDYLMVDFNAFTSIIDRLGGIDVNVTKLIDDPQYPDMNYGYDPFYIEPGAHHLDGATALKYARSRHNSDDIDRQRRQQEVISAVRQQAVDLDNWDTLLLQAPGMWADLDDGIETSLALDQIIELALFARDIPDGNMHEGIVSWEYLFSYTTPTGGSVVVPRRAVLGELMIEVFGENYNQ